MTRANAAEPGYIPEITALRGLAAIFVCAFHLRYTLDGFSVHASSWFKSPFLNKADLWVDFFFVLSGFVLAFRYRLGLGPGLKGWLNYFRSRVARIFPVHVFFVVIYLGFNFFRGLDSFDQIRYAKEVIATLFLVQSWGHYFGNHLNFPSWSLSAEWGAYLVLPFLISANVVIRNRVFWVLSAFLLMLATPFFSLLVIQVPMNQMKELTGLFRSIPEALFGASLSVLFSHGTRRLSGALADLVFTVAVTLLMSFFWLGLPACWFVIPAGGLILALPNAGPIWRRVLLARPLQWLGGISFSLYMSHALVMELMMESSKRFQWKKILNLNFSQTLFLFLAEILICLVLADGVQRLIERPFFKMIRADRE